MMVTCYSFLKKKTVMKRVLENAFHPQSSSSFFFFPPLDPLHSQTSCPSFHSSIAILKKLQKYSPVYLAFQCVEFVCSIFLCASEIGTIDSQNTNNSIFISPQWIHLHDISF
eukprot:TRINITY_DN10898_c0_g1_i14.p1 TRINITY_DN10898_c0_g1~~TRINITY_DN10898_c0_g1_i14.p1  ORF type:complete len:112 (-),score=14.78 TRINITY_DN10898_c0_g1_i14:967-1302(-)